MTSLTYPLTITEADLDRAIAARRAAYDAGERLDVCASCLFAQAVTRQEGKPSNVALSVRIEETRFSLPPPARRIMNLFDDEKDQAVRNRLPITFNLPSES